MKIAIVTAGEDAPGGNAIIRAIVKTSLDRGHEAVGVRMGFSGFISDDIIILTEREVSGILASGGTILGSSNYDPTESEDDLSILKSTLERYEIDAIVVGADRKTLEISQRLFRAGIPIIGIPQTIDNDIPNTDTTVGFHTAVQTVAEALDRLHTTAEAHHRVMVVEVMGGPAGWLATMGGMAGGADYIIVPEFPFDPDDLISHVKQRQLRGKHFSIVVVADGADIDYDKGLSPGEKIKHLLSETGFETRLTVLGNQQRGGAPTVYDRILATRMGIASVELAEKGEFGKMTALQGGNIVALDFDAISGIKYLPRDIYEEASLFF